MFLANFNSLQQVSNDVGVMLTLHMHIKIHYG